VVRGRGNSGAAVAAADDKSVCMCAERDATALLYCAATCTPCAINCSRPSGLINMIKH
jgi:hypothetical protein